MHRKINRLQFGFRRPSERRGKPRKTRSRDSRKTSPTSRAGKVITAETHKQTETPTASSVVIDPKAPYKNERASYAYEYSGKDREFVLLLNAENGAWTHDELHKLKYWREGQLWSDIGFCGISAYYHTDKFTEAKNGDWKTGIRLCHELYTDFKRRGILNSRFHGWKFRYVRGKNIKFNQ